MIFLLSAVGLAGIAGAAWAFLCGEDGWSSKAVLALLSLSAAGLVVMLLTRTTQPSSKEWSNAKLAPVVAMTRGYDLYQDRDTGVMTGWLYGPVGAIVLLPAALAKSPTTARLIGNSITLFCFLAPAAWILAQAVSKSSQVSRVIGSGLFLSALTFFGWLSVCCEDLNRCASVAGPDGPALGLAACSCALIYHRRTFGRMILSALAAVLCVWTKQNYLTLLPALLLWIAFADGLKTAVTYLGVMVGAGVVVSTILLLSFGPSNMYFHMVTLPQNHPLREENLSMAQAWISGFVDLLQNATYSLGLVVVVIALDLVWRPRTVNVRARFVSQRWPLLLVVALFLIPSSLAGYVKFGGYLNNLACTNYFLWLAGLAGLLEVAGEVSTGVAVNRILKKAVIAVLTGIAVLRGAAAMLESSNGLQANGKTLLHPYSNTTEIAFRYCEAHESENYCPWDPLITLLADGKLYHFEYGLVDHVYAKRNPSDQQYAAHLPRFMNKIIYTAEPQTTGTLEVLPDYRQRVMLDEMPGCIVYIH